MCEPSERPGDAPGTPAGMRGDSGPAVSGRPGLPESPGEAMEMVLAGLGWLATADLASAPAVVRADCLRALEQAASVQVAARSAVLSAFDAQCDFQDDGHGTARTWLRWQTQITNPAASAAVGWMRRLNAHRAVRAALAAGTVSASWSRQICDWTDLLPVSARDDADVILLAAAAGGAELADLEALAAQMRRRLCPDEDGGKPRFEDRQVRLRTTLGDTGRLDGDLTRGCAEAVQAVLDALGKKAGPEDTRTLRQRHHDALAEGCRRLIAAGMVPDRAGQPTQIQLHISLDDLLARMGDPAAETIPHPGPAGGPGRSGSGQPGSDQSGGGQPGGGQRGGGPGWPGGRQGAATGAGDWRQGAGWRERLWPRLTPDGSDAPAPVLPGAVAMPGDECDATIVPMVTGHVDHDLLDRLTSVLTGHDPLARAGNDGGPGNDGVQGDGRCPSCGSGSGFGAVARDRVRRQVRDLIVENAVALLSGPHGLASYLRTGRLAPPAGSVSLPLDVGTATDTIPPHLRRAVIVRDRHCAAPGCLQPPAAVRCIIWCRVGWAAPLNCLICYFCAHSITLLWCTNGIGQSPSTPTGPPPPEAPTAPGSCTATARPRRPERGRPARFGGGGVGAGGRAVGGHQWGWTINSTRRHHHDEEPGRQPRLPESQPAASDRRVAGGC